MMNWLKTFFQKPQNGKVSKRSEEEIDRYYRTIVSGISPYLLPVGNQEPVNQNDQAIDTLQFGIEKLSELLEERPESWAIYWFIGKANQALGRRPQAHSAFEKAFELERTNPDVAHEFMHICLDLGHHEDAVIAAEHAVTLSPRDASLVTKLALAYLLAGRMEEASRMARASLTVDPDDKATHQLRAIIEEVKNGRRLPPKNVKDVNAHSSY